MTPPLPSAMTEALQLIRAGKLREATAKLSGGAGPTAGTLRSAPDFSQLHRHLPSHVGGLARQRPAEDELAEGAAFLARRFVGNAGARDYRLYVPSTAATRPLPLIVMLHGCTQDPVDFARGTRMNRLAEGVPMFVAYPEQPPACNAQRCWNWFDPAHQQRGRGEPAQIAGIVTEITSFYPIDPDRVFIAGLSAGGAAALAIANLYPDLFAAVGVHSGLPIGAARDLPTALTAMRQGGSGHPARDHRHDVPTIAFHGSQDGTVHPRNAALIMEQVLGGGARSSATTERHAVQGRRDYRRTVCPGTDGSGRHELWTVEGGGHAWFGGSETGSYTDPLGPDASAEMIRFFRAHPKIGR